MNDMRPPTDNLYKFLAIFGLIVVGFSFYIPLQRLEAFSRSTVLLDVAYEPMIDRLFVVGDFAEAQLHCAIRDAMRKEGQLTKPGSCDKLASTKAAADVANADLVTLRGKVKALELERNFLYQQYVVYSVVGAVLGCIGLVLCVVGFWLWYVRLQRFLDAAVRSEASSAIQSQRRAWSAPRRKKWGQSHF